MLTVEKTPMVPRNAELLVLILNVVGFTLSQATKALRESRGIALLYFRPLH